MARLQRSIQEFVDRQPALPLTDVLSDPAEESSSPYGSWWYRACAALILSGRIQATDLHPLHRTDLNRVCKEANFNQGLCERVARFLLPAGVIQRQHRGRYFEPGPNATPFWNHETDQLPAISRLGVLNLVQEPLGYRVPRPNFAANTCLIEFLTLFFHVFRDRALRADQLWSTIQSFAELPPEELCRLAGTLKVNVDEEQCAGWSGWLHPEKEDVVLPAIYLAEWAYGAEYQKHDWIYPSAIGLAMLGLGPVPPVAPLPTDLKVLSNLSVLAGAGRPVAELALLIRHCRVNKLNMMLELQLERKRLKEAATGESPGGVLLGLFKDLQPLPSTVLDLLQTRSVLGGVLGYRQCSALIKPPNPEALDAIRLHPQLKGFIEPGAPPGYLLLKPSSNPSTFFDRCQALGFEFKSL